jgi:hypothetical protein
MSKSEKERRANIRRLLQQVENVAEYNEVVMNNFLDALWEKQFISKKPEDLATYISAGAEIDDNIRNSLVSILRGETPSIHGRKTEWKDFEFYIDVQVRQSITALNNVKEKMVVSAEFTDHQEDDVEGVSSLEEIFANLATEHLTERGAKAKYLRGRHIARSRLGIGYSWKEGYAHLASYQKREGNCDVPQDHCTEDGLNLGRWVRQQRRKTLTPERIELLNQLGFTIPDPKRSPNKKRDQRTLGGVSALTLFNKISDT